MHRLQVPLNHKQAADDAAAAKNGELTSEQQRDIFQLEQCLSNLKVPANRARVQTMIEELKTPPQPTPSEPTPPEPTPPEPVSPQPEPEQVKKVPSSAPPTAPAPAARRVITSTPTITQRRQPFESFAWDEGSYDSPWVTVYAGLQGVGQVKEGVTCSFSKRGFDLEVKGHSKGDFRLYKDTLTKEILPTESKFVVKRDKVLLKLRKKKGEFSYERWENLTSNKTLAELEEAESKKARDPQAGIMDVMKEMYDKGDENMRKVIGESMMKSRSGGGKDPLMDEPKMPDMPDFSDLNLGGGEEGGFGDDLGRLDGLGGAGMDDNNFDDDDDDYDADTDFPSVDLEAKKGAEKLAQEEEEAETKDLQGGGGGIEPQGKHSVGDVDDFD